MDNFVAYFSQILLIFKSFVITSVTFYNMFFIDISKIFKILSHLSTENRDNMNRYKVMLPRNGSPSIFERKNPVGLIFEPKFDGTRVLIYKEGRDIEIINQRGVDIIYKYPELLDIPFNIKAESCVLDAVIVVLDKDSMPNPKMLQQREQTNSKELIYNKSKTMPSTIFVFDILEKNGQVLINTPLSERKRILGEVIDNTYFIRPCPYVLTGKQLWEDIQRRGMEGLIAKDLNSKYEQGVRSWAWLKINNFNTTNTIVAGFTKGKAERSFTDLILASYVPDKQVPIYIGRISKCLDVQTERKFRRLLGQLKTSEPFLPENERMKVSGEVEWLKPEIIIKVRYMGLTKNNELIEPTFIRLRFDKGPEDCILAA